MTLSTTVPWHEVIYDFKKFLGSLSTENINRQEVIFPDQLIESWCNLLNYPCYKFAHNLKKQPYMRAQIEGFTMEYLVIDKPENPEQKQAYVLQIVKNGEKIYTSPKEPTGTIYVI